MTRKILINGAAGLVGQNLVALVKDWLNATSVGIDNQCCDPRNAAVVLDL